MSCRWPRDGHGKQTDTADTTLSHYTCHLCHELDAEARRVKVMACKHIVSSDEADSTIGITATATVITVGFFLDNLEGKLSNEEVVRLTADLIWPVAKPQFLAVAYRQKLDSSTTCTREFLMPGATTLVQAHLFRFSIFSTPQVADKGTRHAASPVNQEAKTGIPVTTTPKRYRVSNVSFSCHAQRFSPFCQ